MIEEFSGSYYRVEMRVHPFEDGPIIEKGLYDLIDRDMYCQTDTPVMMKLGLDGGPTFRPDSEAAIPTDVLAVPEEMIEKAGGESAEDTNVFIYKPEAAYLFSEKIDRW